MSKKGKIMAKNNWDEELNDVGNDLQRLKENARQRPKIILGIVFAVISSIVLIVTGAGPLSAQAVFAPILAGVFFGVTAVCVEEASKSDYAAIMTKVIVAFGVGNLGVLIHTAVGWGYTTFVDAVGVGVVEFVMFIIGAWIGIWILGGVMAFILKK